MSARTVRLTPLRRHLAAILTIALSTGFVAVMIVAGGLMTQSVSADVSASLRGAQLVATSHDPEAFESPPAVQGSTASWPLMQNMTQLRAGDAETWVSISSLPPEDASPTPLVSGRHARADGELVIDEDAAQALGARVGSPLTVPATGPGMPEQTVTVVGVARSQSAALISSNTGTAYLTTHSATQLLGGPITDYASGWLYAIPEGTDLEELAETSSHDTVAVRTAQTVIDDSVADSGLDDLAIVVGAFLAVALVTASVVIANTFSVTVAQRTRDLALLRTLGATGRQVSAVVLRESLLVALVGSFAGVLGGHLLVQAALAVSASAGWVERLAPVPVSWASVLVPLVAGAVITVAASLLPLRRATEVAPLEALRPVSTRHRSGARRQWRTVLGAITTVIGGAALTGGVAMGQMEDPPIGAGASVLLAMAGGALSLIGVLSLLELIVPPLAGIAGRLLAKIGRHPARLARANTLRDPSRSAATVAALVIGTTLMTMMAVGARTAEVSLTHDLADRKPIDLVVRSESLTAQSTEIVAGVEGIARADAVPEAELELGTDDTMTVLGPTPEQLSAQAARDGLAEQLRDGVLLTGADRAERFGVHDGQRLTVPTATGGTRELTVHVDGNLDLSLVTPEVAQEIAGVDGRTAVLAKLKPSLGSAAFATLTDVSEQLAEAGVADAQVKAEGIERSRYGQILQVLLSVTIALLAVAVLVALVGVANTLSLSVVERTAENGLLRALGTTRGQMQAMLGWEGILLGLIGAGIGIVLGCIYGLTGVASVFAGQFPTIISIPWAQLAALLALTIAAGWLASMLPGRAASRTAPAVAVRAD